MGGKQRWSQEEEAALQKGVSRHGAGKWRLIQKDRELGPLLISRSNVDLKDKWRNLTADQSSKSASKSRASGTGGGRGSKRSRRERRSETPPPRIAATTKRTAAAAAAAAAAVSTIPTVEQEDGSSGREDSRAPRRQRRKQSPKRHDRMAPAVAAAVLMTGSHATSSGGGSSGTRPPSTIKPEDMVVAAVISLGSAMCTQAAIIQWIQGQYHVGRDLERRLPKVLTELVSVGRLEQQGQRSARLFKMAPLKYYDQNGTSTAVSWRPARRTPPYVATGSLNQTAFEAAQAAAAAVAEAAEAGARADRLGEAAHLFELAAAQQAEQEQQQHSANTARAGAAQGGARASFDHSADGVSSPRNAPAAVGDTSHSSRQVCTLGGTSATQGPSSRQWLQHWQRYSIPGNMGSGQLPGQHGADGASAGSAGGRSPNNLAAAFSGKRQSTPSLIKRAPSDSILGMQPRRSLDIGLPVSGFEHNSPSISRDADLEARVSLPPSHAWHPQPSPLQPAGDMTAGRSSPNGLGGLIPSHQNLPVPWPLNVQIPALTQGLRTGSPLQPLGQMPGCRPKVAGAHSLLSPRLPLWQPHSNMASESSHSNANSEAQ